MRRLSTEDLELRFHSVIIKPSSTVRDLSVWLDSELTMHDHILRTSSTCFYHLRKLRQLCGVVSHIAMQRLVSAFVLSRLDYCNEVLAGLPSSSPAPLQRVLYAVVHLVTGLGPCDHITRKMMELHWLPIEHRIKFKLSDHARCRDWPMSRLYPWSCHTASDASWMKQAPSSSEWTLRSSTN